MDPIKLAKNVLLLTALVLYPILLFALDASLQMVLSSIAPPQPVMLALMPTVKLAAQKQLVLFVNLNIN
jgi:hypothetical protein